MRWFLTLLSLFLHNSNSHEESSHFNLNPGSEFDLKPIVFNVELLIVTDYSVYKMHEKIINSKKWNKYNEKDERLVVNHIKTYYTEIINQVNQRFEASFKDDPDIRIKISISNFFISKKQEDSLWSEGFSYENLDEKVNGDLSLIEFNAWIENNREIFSDFDHAFGVTAKDLVSDDAKMDYNGLGYIYGICQKLFSGSLIEDKGAFESVRSFAHELAHNLGTDHDGLANSKECPEWDNYIMAPKFFPYNQLNSWKFSKCSIKKMKEFLLESKNNECLMNEPKENIDGSNYELYPGQIYNLFDQCQLLHGPNSTPCFEYESIFCQSLFCRSNGTESDCVWVAPATEGSDCGEEKWCMKGNCEPKSEKNLKTKKSDDKNPNQEPINKCLDLMDEDFCDTVVTNDYCDEMFYWNGKSIAYDWCKKKCKNC
ncbi:unnamed protein product [Brachionus calyciflorus]|uniref:Peptidase M12B domain-containing protein n=1 Tax=Brachionus calyciflorus TaxID=104777 RepID=A0A814HTK1_9BILA|nr:unnamed protein product [Brachionus calyciflorus]